MLKPASLLPRDRVAIVAPSQAATADVVERAVQTVMAMGLDPVVLSTCTVRGDGRGPLPAQRAQDINHAFYDPEIRGLIALKAGSGTIDVLEHIDYRRIAANPKVFVGFSDITAMHLALGRRCGLVTFHGPLASTKLAQKVAPTRVIDQFSADCLHRALFVARPLGLVVNPSGEDLQCLVSGRTRGRVVGGNLSLLVRTLGSLDEIDTRNALLLMEDFGETLASLRLLLHKMAAAGKLSDCAGAILGSWIQCGEDVADPEERRRGLKQLFASFLQPLGKPTLLNVRAGHCVPMVTLPLGVEAQLDADALTLRYVEPATEERSAPVVGRD